MNETEAKTIVKKRLSTKRYEHTIRVAETATQLAKCYNISPQKAALAGLLHDYAKCDTIDELKQQISAFQLPSELLDYHSELWHGPVGAMAVKEKYRIMDHNIIHAIYYHTTARENMSLLEKVIFVADYIEPGRSFPGVDEVREVAKINLDLAAQRALRNTIIHLLKKEAIIYPDTFLAYNQLTKSLEGLNN